MTDDTPSEPTAEPTAGAPPEAEAAPGESPVFDAEDDPAPYATDDGDVPPPERDYVVLSATGATVPLPDPDDPAVAAWTDDARETILRGVRNAPDSYHVRAWLAAATGDAIEVLTVPTAARVAETPAFDSRADGHGHWTGTAVYEVRLARDAFVSYDDLDAIAADARDAHRDFIDRVATGVSTASRSFPTYDATDR